MLERQDNQLVSAFCEADCAWLQDRHTLIEHLNPDTSADWAASMDTGSLPSFAAVFDGHYRCEPADLCSRRLHALLSM